MTDNNTQIPKDSDMDLFGNIIKKDILLRDKFIEPPFSILDTRQGNWIRRKNQWKELGIKSELGRVAEGSYGWQDLSNNPRAAESSHKIASVGDTASIFDPALTELMYRWFCPDNGLILDPFAGGSVRGIIANYLGYKYTGIELRSEQVFSNREQSLKILPQHNQPNWVIGDSNVVLDTLETKVDFIFSCPPYFDLEVYSDLPEDLSNMNYESFKSSYREIIKKACSKLKSGGYAVWVVGEIRDKDGYYRPFIDDTKNAFLDAGLKFYNDMILLNSVGSASMRTKQFEISKKVVKIHQNVLCFKKP